MKISNIADQKVYYSPIFIHKPFIHIAPSIQYILKHKIALKKASGLVYRMRKKVIKISNRAAP